MEQLKFPFEIPDGYKVIFRASKKLKNGRIIYAKQFGLKGFPMLVKAN